MTDIVIRAENLGKRYRLGEHAQVNALRDALTQSVRSLFSWRDSSGASEEENMIWALRDVSFEIEHGEVVGLIGRNGSGKSTLLKVLARVTRPTTGSAQMQGRLGSLLEVGTGFHGELTGRENIYLSGAILGMKRLHINRRFDDIVSFADIGRFLDTPVKHYSSGMYVRLAFAVAAHLEPDILLVDEVLAVGDSEFQQKCLRKMRQVAYDGRTVLFVSHDLAAVQALTSKTLLLQAGCLKAFGPTPEVIQQYLPHTTDPSATVYDVAHTPRQATQLSRHAEFLRLELDRPTRYLPMGEPLNILATVRGNRPLDHFRFALVIFRVPATPLGTLFGPDIHGIGPADVAVFRLELPELRLNPGMYYCTIGMTRAEPGSRLEDLDVVHDVLHFEVVPPSGGHPLGDLARFVAGPVIFDEPKVERVS